MGFEYQAELSKHESQTDAAKGFGGKFGVQTDRKDKVCVVNRPAPRSWCLFVYVPVVAKRASYRVL